MEAGAVAAAVRSRDGVLCALGPAPGAFTRVCSTATAHILEAMVAASARRLVCVTGAMAGPSENLGLTYRLIRWMVSRSYPDLLPDRRAQEEAIRKSALDWVILRPPRLTPEAARGRYEVGEALRMGPWARIGRADLARFAVAQLTADAHLRRALYIRY
jgi:uncharacterized protein YbjT (DUF2867 family)